MALGARRTLGRIALVVLATALAGAVITGCSASPLKSSEDAASRDLAQLKVKDYAASYAGLSAADRAQVAKGDWVMRCQEVEAATGGISGYHVVGSRWLDAGKTIAAVDAEVDFAKMPRRKTQLFYVVQDGKPVQTMLWGRTVDLARGVR